MPNRRISFLVPRAALICAALLSACSDSTGGGDSTGVALTVSQYGVALSDTAPTGSFFVTTTPSGRLHWQVSSKPAWVTVTPSGGVVDGKPVEVKVTANFGNTEPGVQYGEIGLVSAGGVTQVHVQAEITPNPIASVAPTPVAFAAGVDTVPVTVTNSGRGTLSWSVSSADAWISFLPASGTLGTGQQAVVKAVVDRGPLPVGTASTSIVVHSNAKLANVTVPVNVAVPNDPVPSVSVARLAFGAGVAEQTFWLRNLGKGPLQWTATSANAWVSASPRSGTVAAGDSTLVTTQVDHAAAGNASGTLTLSSNARTGNLDVPVAVSSSGAFSGLTVLDHSVVDAEFSTAAGVLVTVSTGPDRLNIVDPELGTIRTVALAQPPLSVAIRPDGAYALVGHDGFVSYVNLAAGTIEHRYAVTCEALDVILPANGWAYVYPRRDQWAQIRQINLATGQETDGPTVYAGATGRLHPSGNFVYTATSGLSPSNVDKSDVRGGPMKALYSSPYWGDYTFGSPIWFSDDGARLFTSGTNVFRASAVQSEDMRYAGKLVGAAGLAWVTSSTAAARTVAVSTDGGVRSYDNAYLALKGSIPLPSFAGAGGAAVAAGGRFAFFNRVGGKLYVLVKADPSGNLARDWGLAVVSISDVP
ncbi:MAG: chitinase [Gemmatimonadetes bacterium]|nr:chitinase [Gemmatimonadota bacterium]